MRCDGGGQLIFANGESAAGRRRLRVQIHNIEFAVPTRPENCICSFDQTIFKKREEIDGRKWPIAHWKGGVRGVACFVLYSRVVLATLSDPVRAYLCAIDLRLLLASFNNSRGNLVLCYHCASPESATVYTPTQNLNYTHQHVHKIILQIVLVIVMVS